MKEIEKKTMLYEGSLEIFEIQPGELDNDLVELEGNSTEFEDDLTQIVIK